MAEQHFHQAAQAVAVVTPGLACLSAVVRRAELRLTAAVVPGAKHASAKLAVHPTCTQAGAGCQGGDLHPLETLILLPDFCPSIVYHSRI